MPPFVERNPAQPFDVDNLVAACIETSSAGLLLDESSLPEEFFDLGTRLAGELLHGLGRYGLRLAVVVPSLAAHSANFQAFVTESNRGEQARFFRDRADAVAWLESRVVK